MIVALSIRMVLQYLGDLPALAKIAGMKRTHSHVPRASSSKKACQGICWMCRAGQEADDGGQEAYPFEDTSVNASWTTTLGQSLPWDTEPIILQGLPVDPNAKESFFKTDCWHNFHLGLSKHFVASALVSAMERLHCFPNPSVESRMQFLTQDFLAFCRRKKINPYLKEISRDSLSFLTNKSCPVGRWSKGAVATQFMQYLEDFCNRFVTNKTDDEVMLSVVFRHGWLMLFYFPQGKLCCLLLLEINK